jgi:hypothetical protein
MTSQETLREAIRTELAKQNPIDAARKTLELLAETSVRVVEKDGQPVYEILDDAGELRTVAKNGQAAPMTIPDLVAELRVKHPTLFRPAEAEPSAPAAAPVESASASAAPQEAVSAAATRERDWLLVGSSERAPVVAAAWRWDAVRGRIRQQGTQAFAAAGPHLRGAWTAVASYARRLPDAMSGERARGAFERVRRAGSHPPSRYVYAGVAGALVLAALVWLWPDSDPRPTETNRTAGRSDAAPSRSARSDPPATGAVPPPATRPAATPAAGSPPSGAIRGVPEVVDTTTLRIDGKIVRLFGVEWARGGQVEDLTRYLRDREVACTLAAAPDRYRCQVENQDLSRVVLFNGGGRATADASPDLKAAENHAKSEGFGVWRK